MVDPPGGGLLPMDRSILDCAIREVFAENWQAIPVSATKSMTGHLIAAAGAVETGACLLPLTSGVLPPNPCLDAVDAGCELDHVTAPSRAFTGEYVLSNSFGFGGQNATLILRRHESNGSRHV